MYGGFNFYIPHQVWSHKCMYNCWHYFFQWQLHCSFCCHHLVGITLAPVNKDLTEHSYSYLECNMACCAVKCTNSQFWSARKGPSLAKQWATVTFTYNWRLPDMASCSSAAWTGQAILLVSLDPSRLLTLHPGCVQVAERWTLKGLGGCWLELRLAYVQFLQYSSEKLTVMSWGFAPFFLWSWKIMCSSGI